jgi:hypothetical protein
VRRGTVTKTPNFARTRRRTTNNVALVAIDRIVTEAADAGPDHFPPDPNGRNRAYNLRRFADAVGQRRERH